MALVQRKQSRQSSIGDDDKTDPGIVPLERSHPPAPVTALPFAQAPAAVPAYRMPDLGLLNVLMTDPEINEIMVNDVRNVMIERGDKMLASAHPIGSLEELNRITRNLLDSVGKTITPEHPFVDTMLPDGSRVHVIGPPLTQHGPCITIRKFPSRRFALEDLMGAAMMDRRMDYFLRACVLGRMNMLISGGTGSGKSTLLNALLAVIPKSERIVTIEDTPELAVNHVNSVRLQTKLATGTSPAVTARDLAANAMRMRPDRLIIGECRREEAFDILQAMNTGHEGSLTTIHANSARDALARFETLCMLAHVQVPITAIRRQMGSALDVLVQVRRFRNNQRRIVSITEVTGMEGETLTLQDIFLYETDFRCTGFVPTFLSRLRENGIELPGNFFA
jgi:pilus assembly protein CpaF